MTIRRISPMLPVTDLERAMDFYRLLGLEVEQHRPEWGWAMLAAGEFRLMLDQSIRRRVDDPRDAVVYLYVDDVEAVHRALRRSGVDVPGPAVTFYGITEFRLLDPDGNRLWIGQLPS